MENYSIVIFILFIMIGLSALADKIRLPYPVLLITAGIAIGFIPDLPHIELNPEIIFLIFLPPLLYDAAFNIDAREFRTHFNTISTLAISLVFISAAAIAVVAYFLIPGMTWPLAFVLGSILSATDAVAAINVTKGLGLSHKTTTILEGESLVNDASALVAYHFAVAAVTGTAFVIWKASLEFVVLMAGGLLIGFIAAKALGYIIRLTKHNSLATISFMLLMPFVAYRVAEEMNVSGVIAVVVLGLAISRYSHQVLPESVRKESKSFWDVIIFLLNGLIFILIGLQFPYVVESMNRSHLLLYIGYALLIAAVAFLVRLVRVLTQRISLQRGFQYKRGRITENALLDLRSSLIISWSGMRGIVSLATAMALPATLENGEPFPLRSATIFIATAVVLITIVGQGTTLPWLVKWLAKKGPEPEILAEPEVPRRRPPFRRR
ncbi:MAG: Na+/H+ antiporter [Candidatus Pseudobacter hemicellulosilyticus]|uniref:Na+/H+ antiporter n=1 Tax=Candidatus Pseudobacter hemicellulosilyticus TaxID=3121375 RepID=A0AAJ5WPQ2_9BACT|nr:MAG: Na+/H+ antiporter [Pseudobacter sp.]